MAVATTYYHRNYDSSDSTLISREGKTYVTPETIGWSAPSGYSFSSWNTQSNGSGVSYNVGDTCTGLHVYAIWERIPTPYLVTDIELEEVADAIRDAGGTQAALEWPNEFVDAIADLGGGGTLYTLSVSDPYSTGNYAYDTHGNTITTAQLYEGQTFFICKNQMTYVISSPSISPTLQLVRYTGSSRYEDASVYEMPASDITITFDYT